MRRRQIKTVPETSLPHPDVVNRRRRQAVRLQIDDAPGKEKTEIVMVILHGHRRHRKPGHRPDLTVQRNLITHVNWKLPGVGVFAVVDHESVATPTTASSATT